MSSIFRSTKFGSRTSLSDYNVSGKLKTQHSQNTAKFSVTGGTTLTPGNGYKYHIFTSPGNLVVIGKGSIDYIIVAGGGAGGAYTGASNFNDTTGGGGGAGGYLTNNNVSFNAGKYTITIGSGGFGAGPPNGVSTSGTPSSISGPGAFTTLIAIGGGRGGYFPGANASPGGSGGGSWYGNTPISAGTGTSGQGNPGATPSPGSYNRGAGGGGGASTSGGIGNSIKGGNGGIGLVAFDGDTGIPSSYGTPGPSPGRWFAGGGGGGNADDPNRGQPGLPNFAPFGGSGGGGAGGTIPAGSGTPGTINTGGGGGGASGLPGSYSPGSGGSGGSGIVIIRYLV